jgi:type VI secretion system secreted protein VgrG
MAIASQIRIDIEGTELKDFLDLYISQGIYSPNEFEITCRMDAFEEKNGFVMEHSKKFIGSMASITIESKAKGESQPSEHIFKGLITTIRTTKSYTGETDRVILAGYSPDILLNDDPGCFSFENKSLKQITDEILRPYPRDVLKSKTDPVKTDSLNYTVQYNENRYAFLRRLAARFGEWFYYDGTKLIFGRLPDVRSELKLGQDLTDFNFSVSMNPLKFKYIAYDASSAAPIEVASSASGGKDNLNKYGGVAHDASMKEYSQQSKVLYNHINVRGNSYNKELIDVVKLKEGSSALKMSVLNGSSQNPKLKPGSKVNIKALKMGQSGDVDYGEFIITSIVHRCDNTMNYRNDFEGIPAEAKIPDYTNPFDFPRCETQNAVVKDNNDPDKLGRVRVSFFWQENNMMSPWIRPVNQYSGTGRGFYFIPEKGDEVIVGFEGGDAERPYLIGSVYNGLNKPDAVLSDKDNSFKGIVTGSKLKIEFDDKKKITTIETPAGNKVILNDDQKTIIMQDQNNNKVELGSGGITLESVKDIKITSKSKITIEGTAGVDISSKADAKVTGLNVDLTANMGLTAKGNATAELSATGQTTLKGAIVMIN